MLSTRAVPRAAGISWPVSRPLTCASTLTNTTLTPTYTRWNRVLISLPTVAVGLVRYGTRGAFDRRPLVNTVAPMGVGSVVGATVGGLLVGLIPAAALKLLLGVILNVSAWRMFHHSRA